jgi:hypothetical protein
MGLAGIVLPYFCDDEFSEPSTVIREKLEQIYRRVCEMVSHGLCSLFASGGPFGFRDE